MPKIKWKLDGTDIFFWIVMYIQLKQIIEKENVEWDLVLFMGCWLDAGRSECKFAVSCKSGMCHQRAVSHFTGGLSYDILMKKKIIIWNDPSR